MPENAPAPQSAPEAAKPRLLMLMPSLGRGGAERAAATLLPWLAARFYVILVLLHDRVEYPLPADVEVVRLWPGRAGRLRSLLLAPLHLLRFIHACRRLRPQLVLSFMEQANIVNLAGKLWDGHRAVISQRVMPRQQQRGLVGALVRCLARALYPRADLVHAVSGDVRDETIAAYGCPPARVRALPNPIGIRVPAAGTVPPPLAHPYLLHVGRVNFHHKRQDLLLCAYARLRTDTRLVYLGEGPDMERLRALVAARGLRERVMLAGWRDPVPYLLHARALVMCSRYEGCPNVMLEALACSCPVVAIACPGGPARILDQGRCGVLLPDDADAETLARALRDMLDNPDQRERYRAFARRRAAHYAPERIGPAFARMLAAVGEPESAAP